MGFITNALIPKSLARYPAGQSTDGFHFLSLLKMGFQLLALGDVFIDNQLTSAFHGNCNLSKVDNFIGTVTTPDLVRSGTHLSGGRFPEIADPGPDDLFAILYFGEGFSEPIAA